MKTLKLIILLLLVSCIYANAQEQVLIRGKKYFLHIVKDGETVKSICKKYKIDKDLLKQENIQVNYGITKGDILKIPVKGRTKKLVKQNWKEIENITIHMVKKGETLYSIAQKYSIQVRQLMSVNPKAFKEIGIGDELIIPPVGYVGETEKNREDGYFIYHRVLDKETLYSISKIYNKGIELLIEYNPGAADGLKLGEELRIPKQEDTFDEHVIKEGQKVFSYIVETGDTFFALQKRYGLNQEQLIELNPMLKEGLKAGMKLHIPVDYLSQKAEVEIDNSKYTTYTVGLKETLYTLARRHNTSVAVIKDLNPELRKYGLIAGQQLVLPLVSSFTTLPGTGVEIIETTTPKNIFEELAEIPVSEKTYNIGIFLPLFLDINDAINRVRLKDEVLDSLKAYNSDPEIEIDSFQVRENKVIYQRSLNFLQFYEGFLLAVEKLQKHRFQYQLQVFDTKRDKNYVSSVCHKNDMRDLDLIVGPIYETCQEPVTEIARKHEIPMISPLSSGNQITLSNSHFYQINPDIEYQLKETAGMIADNYFDKNLIILNMNDTVLSGKDNMFVELIREKLFGSGAYTKDNALLYYDCNYQQEGFVGLQWLMSSERDNVVVITTDDPAQVSIAVNSLSVLAEEYDITLVGRASYPRLKSIQTAAFHKLKLNYLTPYYVDYHSGITTDFIHDYRECYFTEPNQFSIQGYDTGIFFLSALMKYGSAFPEKLAWHRPALIQSDYNFRKIAPDGGRMNHTLFEIQYTSDFDIIKLRKRGDLWSFSDEK